MYSFSELTTQPHSQKVIIGGFRRPPQAPSRNFAYLLLKFSDKRIISDMAR